MIEYALFENNQYNLRKLTFSTFYREAFDDLWIHFEDITRQPLSDRPWLFLTGLQNIRSYLSTAATHKLLVHTLVNNWRFPIY